MVEGEREREREREREGAETWAAWENMSRNSDLTSWNCIQELEFRVSGYNFAVSGLGIRGFRLGVCGLKFEVSCLRFRHPVDEPHTQPLKFRQMAGTDLLRLGQAGNDWYRPALRSFTGLCLPLSVTCWNCVRLPGTVWYCTPQSLFPRCRANEANF